MTTNLDALKTVPADTIRVQEVSEKLANVAQSICVQAVSGFVNVPEDFLEFLGVDSVDCAKTLREQAIELLIRSLLSAAVEKHVTELSLLAWFKLHFHKFMCALFEVQTRMNRQIDRSSQRNQVRFGVVYDLSFLRCFFLVVA